MKRRGRSASRIVPRFLTTDQVLVIHQEVISRHGGSGGVRSVELLDSAVHAPQASFGGEFMYPSLCDMAAVYMIHLASNHAFVDGNKRTAWVAAKTFLRINDVVVRPRQVDVVETMLGIASGEIRDWKEVSGWLALQCKM